MNFSFVSKMTCRYRTEQSGLLLGAAPLCFFWFVLQHLHANWSSQQTLNCCGPLSPEGVKHRDETLDPMIGSCSTASFHTPWLFMCWRVVYLQVRLHGRLCFSGLSETKVMNWNSILWPLHERRSIHKLILFFFLFFFFSIIVTSAERWRQCIFFFFTCVSVHCVNKIKLIQEGNPDIPLPSDTFQLLLGNPRVGHDGGHIIPSASSESALVFLSRGTYPENLQKESSKRHPNQMP